MRSHPFTTDLPAKKMPSTSVHISYHKERKSVIATDNLLLRHYGILYAHPECMKGVPVEKVNCGHSYWEESWPDLQISAEQTQQFWTDKFNAVRDPNDNVKRYYYNHQVNRGTTILTFLVAGKISPFQFLSKRYVKTVGRGSIGSYDTLYQLCHTIEELLRFELDIEPVDRLRLRLHELIEEQGPKFSLSRTVRDFFHDPKLAVPRDKSGFARIGRPPGQGRGKRETRRVLRCRTSHIDTSLAFVSEAVVQLPDAASRKDDEYNKGGNNANVLLPWDEEVIASRGLAHKLETIVDEKPVRALQLDQLNPVWFCERRLAVGQYRHDGGGPEADTRSTMFFAG